MLSENSLVRYKNALNKASFDLDAFELRIILAAVAQLPAGKLASDCFLPVSANDLTLIGVDPKNAYSALKKACDTLFERHITWDTTDEDGDLVVIKTRWLQEAAYIDQKGRLMVKFSQRVAEHLERLLPNITQFAYVELHSISGAYAIRLYQLLAQFQHSPEKRFFIKLEDLKERLSIGDKYKTYSKFKQGVLEQGIREINEAPYAAFRVRMSDRERGCKDGRKVVCLHFYILPKEHPTPKNLPVIDADSQEVDRATGDLFAGGLSLNRAKLSEKQIGMYADFLSGKNDRFSAVAHAFYEDSRKKGLLDWTGLSIEQCSARLREKLRDPQFVIAVYAWLKKVGFGG